MPLPYSVGEMGRKFFLDLERLELCNGIFGYSFASVFVEARVVNIRINVNS